MRHARCLLSGSHQNTVALPKKHAGVTLQSISDYISTTTVVSPFYYSSLHVCYWVGSGPQPGRHSMTAAKKMKIESEKFNTSSFLFFYCILSFIFYPLLFVRLFLRAKLVNTNGNILGVTSFFYRKKRSHFSKFSFTKCEPGSLRGWKNENTKRQLVKKEGKGINKRRN